MKFVVECHLILHAFYTLSCCASSSPAAAFQVDVAGLHSGRMTADRGRDNSKCSRVCAKMRVRIYVCVCKYKHLYYGVGHEVSEEIYLMIKYTYCFLWKHLFFKYFVH